MPRHLGLIWTVRKGSEPPEGSLEMPLFRAEELTYSKVRALDPAKTICFLPVSALEVHGPHLPLGMDLFMALWMAEETGRRFAERHPDWNVLLYPAVPVGADELAVAGSVDCGPQAVYRAVLGHGRSLARSGFRFVVVTNGHGGPRHAATLESVCRSVSRRYRISMFTPSIAVLHAIVSGRILSRIEEVLGRPLSDEERQAASAGGEHAGLWETSFMLAGNPSLVEPNWRDLPPDAPPKVAFLAGATSFLARVSERLGFSAAGIREVGESLSGGVGWLLNMRYGYGGPTVTYHGSPAAASPELGSAFREVLVRECLEVVEEVALGRRSALEVRSIASSFPPIRAEFARRLVWAGALALLGVLAL
ncbi:MAG: hypothetical protein KatS3mg076_2270 [Candidatus Binatia bacterium]|nr:MAG: hypothetical protein KatS3mg076_2270 [Candidatus Binatia bacterium]